MRKRVGVGVEKGLQLGVGGRRRFEGVLGRELELLPQAAADDGVVAVQPQGHRLAHRDLLAHVLVQLGLELLLVGRPVPGAAETGRHRVHLPRRDDDALAAPRIAAAQVEDDEENGADQQELDERLAQPAHEGHAS